MAVRQQVTIWSRISLAGPDTSARPVGPSPVWRFVRLAGDVSSEPTQRLSEARVTAVDVVGSADGRDAIGNKPGDDQCRPGPDVAGLDGRAGKSFDAMHHDVMPIDAGISSQTGEPSRPSELMESQ